MGGTGYQDPSCVKTAICSKYEEHKTWNYWYHSDDGLCDDCYYIGGKYKDLTKEEVMRLEKMTSKYPEERFW